MIKSRLNFIDNLKERLLGRVGDLRVNRDLIKIVSDNTSLIDQEK